jgi:D-alanyl-D-alanine dipeptidase
MTILLCDPRVSAVPVREEGVPLVRLAAAFGPAQASVRADVAERLRFAQQALPIGVRLRVIEGHRSIADQEAIIARYRAEVRIAHPSADDARVHELTSRFVSPVDVAPHVAGAAVDLTLTTADGDELDMGTVVDATPEQSDGACYFAATNISDDARANRDLLAKALGSAGLVNYPTEWWHWSYGDRYWALMTGAPAALFGPVTEAIPR